MELTFFWNNHDLPRIVSKRGDEGVHRVVSAKMLATLLHLLKGTPYVYQGEEIGMTNVRFEDLSSYNDLEIHNFYKENIEAGFTHEEMMSAIWENGRDNARTPPVQWTSEYEAGFTTGTPWLAVNSNYTKINVADALVDNDSIFYHYQKLIELRKMHEIIVYGDFMLLEEDSADTFNYVRHYDDKKLYVINNMTKKKKSLGSNQKTLKPYLFQHLMSVVL